MSTLIIPTDIMKDMICITCKNYLSFFPVYIKNDGSNNAVCGRCKVAEEDSFIRDIAYENIAQYLLFPCCYKSNGCKEQLIPPKLIDHEKCCIYQKFECPTKVYTKCQWEGACTDLKCHFKEKHPSLLLTSAEFELNFIKPYKENSLLCWNDDIFIVKKEVNSMSDNFICSVQHLLLNDTEERYDYFLRLTNENKTYSCTLPKATTTDGKNTTTVNNSFIKEKLNDPASVLVTIEIVKANTDVPEEQTTVNDIKKNPKIHWDLLNILECPICFDYMLPPIYQCIVGHSICSECKPKISACSICQKGIQDTRNFDLEKMTLHLTYPCKFFKSGCTYFSKATEINTHEDNCEFGPYDCPLKETENCPWKSSISEIIGHVDNNHNNFVLISDRINIEFNKDQEQETIHLIKYSGRVFKLYFKYTDKKFLWSMQLVGPPSQCKKFKYEIDVVDNSGNKLRWYTRGLCVPLTEKGKSFNNPRNYIMLVFEQLEPLVTDIFSYRVHLITE